MIEIFKAECEILLKRALLNQDIAMFGEDGCGKYGTCDRAVIAKCVDLEVIMVAVDEENPEASEALVEIVLFGYYASATGMAITDQNLRISLNILLDQVAIDPTCLDWGPAAMQGERTVVMTVNVKKLLDW